MDGAYDRINESIQRYAEELSDKICEIEKRSRAAGVGAAEFTASNVIKADEALRHDDEDNRSKVATTLVNVSAPIFMGAAGLFGNYLHSVWQAAVFGAVSALAMVSTWESVRRGRK